MNGRRAKALRKVALKAYKEKDPYMRAQIAAKFPMGTHVDPWGRFWRMVKRNWTRNRG